MLESEQEKEIRDDIGGRMNKENSPEMQVQLSLSKLHQSTQARPNRRPLGEQYKTPTRQIKKRQGDIPSLDSKQDVKMTRIGGWAYNSLCNRAGRLSATAVNKTILFTSVFVSMLSTHPGITIGRSRPMAERLCWVFVVDLQAGMIRNVPVRGRGDRW